ncbi:MAG: nicotinamide mononucleotide transporter [Holdemanella sp.]|nr:nicotinamide mononucleotide transporter [Holdemanella sp.]
MSKLGKYVEPNKKVKRIEEIVLILLLAVTTIAGFISVSNIYKSVKDTKYVGEITMKRDTSQEDYDEDCKVCDVYYVKGKDTYIKRYTYEEYVKLKEKSITAFTYEVQDGTKLFFDKKEVSKEEMQAAYKEVKADQMASVSNFAISTVILLISVLVMYLFGSFFTTYEKCWFLSIMTLATVVGILLPEESANGVNGIVIMFLYLLDTFLNILCELLISKQSRYNFLVSIAVEITEILICIVLMYRFATMVTTLFFWLPIDILSFINWTKHKDEQEDELTVVRRLKGYQEVLIIIAILVWTVVVGYFLSGLDIQTDFIKSQSIETAIAYLDACASAVGVANGLFIFFRLREQWIAWYICAILESIINVISGQYVLLVLKLGYITNTTYGYIKWSKYIKTHKEDKKLTLF